MKTRNLIALLIAALALGAVPAHAQLFGGFYPTPAIIERTLAISGALGGLSSTAAATLLQGCTVSTQAGHFVDLVSVDDLNGSTCTTAPTYNVRDDTAGTTGTASTASTSAGQVTQAETLTFAAGDRICLVRTINGGTCTTPVFTFVAHYSTP